MHTCKVQTDMYAYTQKHVIGCNWLVLGHTHQYIRQYAYMQGHTRDDMCKYAQHITVYLFDIRSDTYCFKYVSKYIWEYEITMEQKMVL